LLQDRDCVVNVDFDHICEFVGNIQEQFDYWKLVFNIFLIFL
jgi:hypothetical protein